MLRPASLWCCDLLSRLLARYHDRSKAAEQTGKLPHPLINICRQSRTLVRDARSPFADRAVPLDAAELGLAHGARAKQASQVFRHVGLARAADKLVALF